MDQSKKHFRPSKDITGIDRLTCFSVEQRTKSKRYGMTCNRFIAERNTDKEIAGKFHCICGVDYEVKNNRMTIISSESKT